MKTASVSELKNGLSGYLRAVMSGETVVVTDRRRPVAVFQPIGVTADDEQLAGLIAGGIVSPASEALDLKAFFGSPLPSVPGGLTALIQEDRDER